MSVVHFFCMFHAPIVIKLRLNLHNNSLLSDADSQNVVIGLLLFSLSFGLLATILACCGVLSGALAKKLYYFHSAGEIFFICCKSTNYDIQAF